MEDVLLRERSVHKLTVHQLLVEKVQHVHQVLTGLLGQDLPREGSLVFIAGKAEAHGELPPPLTGTPGRPRELMSRQLYGACASGSLEDGAGVQVHAAHVRRGVIQVKVAGVHSNNEGTGGAQHVCQRQRAQRNVGAGPVEREDHLGGRQNLPPRRYREKSQMGGRSHCDLRPLSSTIP